MCVQHLVRGPAARGRRTLYQPGEAGKPVWRRCDAHRWILCPRHPARSGLALRPPGWLGPPAHPPARSPHPTPHPPPHPILLPNLWQTARAARCAGWTCAAAAARPAWAATHCLATTSSGAPEIPWIEQQCHAAMCCAASAAAGRTLQSHAWHGAQCSAARLPPSRCCRGCNAVDPKAEPALLTALVCPVHSAPLPVQVW